MRFDSTLYNFSLWTITAITIYETIKYVTKTFCFFKRNWKFHPCYIFFDDFKLNLTGYYIYLADIENSLLLSKLKTNISINTKVTYKYRSSEALWSTV